MGAEESGAVTGQGSPKVDPRYQGMNTRLLNQMGRQLLLRLALVMRTSSIHDVRNEALQSSIEFFLQVSNELVKSFGPIVLQGDEDQIYINDFRIRGDATVYGNIRWLVSEMQQRGAGGITLHQEVSRIDVLRFIEVLKEYPPRKEADEEGYRLLNAAIEARGVESISFNRPLRLGAAGELGRFGVYNKRKAALKTYAKILVAMKRVLGQGPELKPVDRLKLVKNIQTLIDLCYDDELFFNGLNSLKCEGDYTYFHPVHASMLSILMGKHIGLTKRSLMDLATASLFYDLGRVKLGQVQLEKPQTLTAEEWDAVRRHPLRSAREVLRSGHLSQSVRKRLLVAFEHHTWLKEGGYPQQIQFRSPHLFSRIVAIADAYDALTTARPHRDGYLPTEALRIMMDEAGRRFDPVLLKVLINILQVFPMGTLVLLDTGEMASVYHNHSDPELHQRPIVRLLSDVEGRPITPRTVDLSEKGPGDTWLRSIVRALDPEEARLHGPAAPF